MTNTALNVAPLTTTLAETLASKGISAPVLAQTTAEAVVRRPAKNQCQAAVVFRGGWIVSATKGQLRSCLKDLERQIIAKGGRPPAVWTTRDYAPSATATTPAQQPVVAEKPYEPPVVPAAPSMDQGWITPWSDPAAYAGGLNSAVSKVLSLGYVADKATSSQFRQDVNKLMESLGLVGAYRAAPNGRPFWSFVPGFQDPSGFSARRGDGDRREAARQIQTGERPVPYKYPHGTPEQIQAATAAGKVASTAANQAHNAQTGRWLRAMDPVRTRAYKHGFCAALRSMGLPPHEKYEADLQVAK